MDTINRYLDQNLPPAELEELGGALLADRDLAASFARAARLDQTLEESFTEITSEAEFGELVALLTRPKFTAARSGTSQAPARPPQPSSRSDLESSSCGHRTTSERIVPKLLRSP